MSSSSLASPFRAWCYLVWMSWQRQARVRQMVWIALALLVCSVIFVALLTAAGRWNLRGRHYPTREELTLAGWEARFDAVLAGIPWPSPAGSVPSGVIGATDAVLNNSDFYVFSTWIIFSIFVSFLLPLWSLSFATEAFGGDREGSHLIWLLTRPLSRPAIYLAKFVALLPWSLTLNLGGFALLCAAAGRPGPYAFRLFWPAVLCASMAFSALFYLMGALVRRPAIVAIVYAFFLEAVLGNMPGYMKRISISFYTRCMMFEASLGSGLQPEKPSVYLPVDGGTALAVLLGVTAVLLLMGMILFSRSEFVAVD